MENYEDEKPPPSICDIITSRILSSSNDRRIARRREVALLQRLSSPMLKSRIRNDMVILASDGLLSKGVIMLEHAEEFEEWLNRLLKDSKQKLNMSDRTIAYILLREGTQYYLKDICNDELRNTKEHN